MSLNDILGTARSGLAASQAAMRVVSNNITNAGTAGYARETLAVSTGVAGGRVNGVLVGEVSRVADKFLENTVYNRASGAGWGQAAASYLSQLQSLMGAVGSESGLSARLNSLSASATKMTSLPTAPQTIAQFTGDIHDAITLLGQLDSEAGSLQGNVAGEISGSVDRSNALLSRIHDLNNGIAQRTASGQSLSGLENERASALEELGGIMKISVREQADGRVTIDSGSGQVLLDRRLRVLHYPAGAGAQQPLYPSIDIRFANPDGTIGAATGERIESSSIGGKMGALINLRDNIIPGFSGQLGTVFAALAETLNAASNGNTTVPAPNTLSGRSSGLVDSDRLGFTGATSFAVLARDGTLIAKTNVDFDALGPTATVDDAIDVINAGLAPHASASLVDGKLSISAADPSNGVALGDDPANPSQRAGVGFSQFFGLNDVVRSEGAPLVPTGFNASDPMGFTAGETTQFVLRDTAGRMLATHMFTATGTETYGDMITQLNTSPVGAHGSFAIDDRGRVQFSPNSANLGAKISIPVDSTDRHGTGLSFSEMSGLNPRASGLANAGIRPEIANDPTLLPLAKLQLGAAIGEKAIGGGDIRGATDYVDRLIAAVDMGGAGKNTFVTFSNQLIADVASQTRSAEASFDAAAARYNDAVSRRDNFAGVNVDDELANMVVLQNSYSAAARVMTTASDMYDTLLAMLG